MNQNRPSKKRKLAAEADHNKKHASASSKVKAKEKARKSSEAEKSSISKAQDTVPIKPRSGKSKMKTQDVSSTPTNAIRKSITIVAGSYDRILYGLNVDFQEKENQVNEDGKAAKKTNLNLRPVFIFPAHISCVKAVATSPRGGKWLATGGTDESIKIWDLGRKKELGSLQQHQGSVTVLSFPTRSHLLSASEDGTICLYHTRDWAVLSTLRGHKGRVNAVAVHPSSKVCLSVGKDRVLRMWDLMRGKGSASIKLGQEADGVRWNPSGSYFAVHSENTIDIYSTKMTLLTSVNHPARIHDIRFCQLNSGYDVLMVAAEDKRVTVYSLDRLAENALEDGPDDRINVICYLGGHTNRVKSLDVLSFQDATYVTTVSSDGRIHLYEVSANIDTIETSKVDEPFSIEPLAVYDTKGSRLTCVTIVEGRPEALNGSLGEKRERSESSDEADDG